MKLKKEIGTLNNLMLVAFILVVGIGYSWMITTMIDTHKENTDWIRNHHNPVIIEKTV